MAASFRRYPASPLRVLAHALHTKTAMTARTDLELVALAKVLRNPHATDGKNPNPDGVNDGFITLTAAQGLAAANVIQYGNA